ncbi:Cys-tRNA(Pro) deacylase [Aquitalea sp. FJL05]|uniref:aminoacyl-tRNA deacylase n=1 Tax=Aquitalea TaxID=407217 RepID=UPI000F5B60AB|nr:MULTISPECIES: aminoacyl-tRNA deacylase [Aquitalea]RQO68124.1 Cys-tRNA(Pro) deacylase [Aquitalea sp. FJL05]
MQHQTIAGSTPALRFLLDHKVEFSCHAYRYEEHGGTATPARELEVNEHAVIKTLLFEDQDGLPLVVLMHGDCKVSAKELARQLPCKKVQPCKPDVANRHSGYLVGGTSPFATRTPMPVYMEASILQLPKVYINGGRRGLQVAMSPVDIGHLLQARCVEVALAK